VDLPDVYVDDHFDLTAGEKPLLGRFATGNDASVGVVGSHSLGNLTQRDHPGVDTKGVGEQMCCLLDDGHHRWIVERDGNRVRV
jgi:hypothetical protein